jgi:hypothetical protein
MDVPIPLSEKMYCSPLTYSIQTNAITFQGLSGLHALVM